MASSCLQYFVLVALLNVISATSVLSEDRENSLPGTTLFRLTVSADIDGAIGPGGWEKVQDVDLRLLSKVANCRAKVMSTGRDWAAAKQLPIELDKEVDTLGQLLIWADSKKGGFYELVYKANLQAREATVTFNYYDRSSLVVTPPYTTNLETLKEKIAAAMGCTE
jgi:hypothetical protein